MKTRLTFDQALVSAMRGSKITEASVEASDRGVLHEVRLILDGHTTVTFLPVEGRLVVDFRYERG